MPGIRVFPNAQNHGFSRNPGFQRTMISQGTQVTRHHPHHPHPLHTTHTANPHTPDTPHRVADLANSNSSRNTAKHTNLIINVPSWSYLHRAQFFVKKHRTHELLEMGFAWRANRSHHPREYFVPHQMPPAAI